ncbi:MAG: transcriptional repressor [Spirochaetales bacterium]|nr:transcriptional repressor [Spirochaetales bacterium]
MSRQEIILKEYLRKRGLRYTPERKIVLQAILSIDGHFDVDDLYDWVRRHDESLSKATVYRAIPLFEEIGFLKESIRSEGRATYECAFGHEHHDHLVCVCCGKIIEFKDELIEELQQAVCRRYRFDAIEHKLSIRGYCSECAENMQKKSQEGDEHGIGGLETR